MNNYKIKNIAFNDIRGITDNINKYNKSASLDFIKEIKNTFERLALFPNIGTIRKDFTYKNVRFFVFRKKFLIIYNIEDSNINILRVLSTYQEICNLI